MMKSIIALELRRLWRTRTAWMLMAASLAWLALVPHLVRSDGTAAGARELLVKYSLGGVFALCAVSLAASGAASLANERESKRLSLARVRPVSRFSLALGRTVALTALGATALALAAAAVAARTGVSRPCSHVLSPVMESARAEAEKMYDIFMADPETPPEAKRAKKSIIMRLLTQRASDNYQSIGPGECAAWTFATPKDRRGLAVRLRFTNDFDVRDAVRGPLRFLSHSGSISNITQAVVIVPLCAPDAAGGRAGDAAPAADAAQPKTAQLTFRNDGVSSLMLRPRKDINLLIAADSFGANILRAYVQLVAALATLLAFAVFLGAGLGRPVAIFTCLAFLFAAFVSDDVLEQYPDSLESDGIDRVGLAITRAVETVSHPVASLHPISSLAADECVESDQTLRVALLDGLLLPLVLALASGFVLSRRE